MLFAGPHDHHNGSVGDRYEVEDEAGLSVAWIGDDPPLDNRAHFLLTTVDGERRFSASAQNGFDLLVAEDPELSTIEAVRAAREDTRFRMSASDIDLAFDPALFVRVWHRLVTRGRSLGELIRVEYSQHDAATGERRVWAHGDW